jgi:hypothetical protein
VLHEQLGDKRLRLNDEQRRRLVVKANKVGQHVLRELTTIVAPQTLPTGLRPEADRHER